MNVNSARLQLSKMLNVGKSRIWISPDAMPDIKKAITKDDLQQLVKDGKVRKIITAKSRGRARILALKKKKGRKKGYGKRKGLASARCNTKDKWMTKVRAQRRYIKNLKENKDIDSKKYRELYRKIKGGFFRSKAHIDIYLGKVKE